MQEIKVECEFGCDELVTINKMNEHRYTCESSEFICSIENCKFKGSSSDAMNHMLNDHELYLIILAEQFGKLQSGIEKYDNNSSYCKLVANNNMRQLNIKMNNYKSDISEFLSESSFFDELI